MSAGDEYPKPIAGSRLAACRDWVQSRPRYLQLLVAIGAASSLMVILLLAYALLIVAPLLPSLDALTDYQPKIPLRVYTADHALIGEFGEEHRNFVKLNEIPMALRKAVIAIEDDRFYEHGGVNYKGVLRATLVNLKGGSAQGASTITMQVARNFFLSREKTLSRKINEIMLSYKIEAKLTKDQILELYMNQIYLGQRAYGFASASEVYFGKNIRDLSLAQSAMLAGLPKAPSAYNPIVNPTRARQRQQYILLRMRDLNYITLAQYTQAVKEDIHVLAVGQQFKTHAEYAAEVVRQSMYAQYKDEIYTRGFSVYTTLIKAEQDAAYDAVRRGVTDYDRRHGYRGPETYIELPSDEEERQDAIDEALSKRANGDETRAAVVTAASAKTVRAQLFSGDVIDMSGEGLRFAAAGLAANARAPIKIKPGAVIRVEQDAKGKWSITQLPQVAAAFIALNAQTGAYRAMVGGYDFNLNKFDHVTQAWRQPGSSIKPFIYSAALEKGFSPATIINDSPISLGAAYPGGPVWEPRNDDGIYDGPVTMRTALAKSKNVVSVRILKTIGAPYTQAYLARFGFDPNKHPANLTMALGTGSVTPLQMAGAYTIFANGGYQITPYLIQKIVDARGNLLAESKTLPAPLESTRVLDPRNAFLVDTMLREVVRSGTGAMATQRLGRMDLAGKTGTTSEAVDGWFAGYSGDVVAVAWMGYDDPKSLGGREFGATLALPIWTNYMRVALRGKAEFNRGVPAGLTQNEGEWSYDEYLSGTGIRALGQDGLDAPGGSGGQAVLSAPNGQNLQNVPPAPEAPSKSFLPSWLTSPGSKPVEKDKNTFDKLYGGG